MSKHTPGPWVYRRVEEGHEILMGAAIHSPNRYPSHCKVEYYHDVWPEDGEQYEEAEANARLIAAAPDLYDALVKLHSLLDFEEQLENGETISFEDTSAINEAFAAALEAIRKAEGREME